MQTTRNNASYYYYVHISNWKDAYSNKCYLSYCCKTNTRQQVR